MTECDAYRRAGAGDYSVDRFTGEVCVSVVGADGSVVWNPIFVVADPSDLESVAKRISLFREKKVAIYRARIDLIIIDGEWTVGVAGTGGIEFGVDNFRFPRLLAVNGEAPEIVRHTELVRSIHASALTESWKRRGFSDEQIRDIRYYRKGGPYDGGEVQRFEIVGRRG